MKVTILSNLLSVFFLGTTLFIYPCHAKEKVKIDQVQNAAKKNYSGIIAHTNDEITTAEDLKECVNLMMLLTGANPEGPQRKNFEEEVLKERIYEQLKQQQLDKLSKLTKNEWVSKEEIESAFADVAKKHNMKIFDFEKLLKSRGIKKETLINKIKTELGWESYINARYGKEVNISDQEAEQTAKEIKKRSAQEAFLVSKIFFPISDPSAESAVLNRVNNIMQLLKRGAKFADVARQFSGGAATANNGGNLGWVFEGQLSAAEMDALKTMQIGTYKMVKNDRGYSILLLNDKKSQGLQTYNDINFKQAIYPFSKKPTPEIMKEVLTCLNEMKNSSKNCYEFMKTAQESGTMVISDEISGTLESMIDEYRRIIAKVPVGGISEPIVTENGIIFVCLLKKETKKIEPPSAKEIKNHKRAEKLTALSERELRMLIKKSSIRVDHKYSLGIGE